MSSVCEQEVLPTLDYLGVTIPDDLDVAKTAQEWLTRFSQAIAAKDVSAILKTMLPYGWWRDLLALTWDIRTFHGANKIKKFLDDRLSQSQLSVDSKILVAMVGKPLPELPLLVVQFTFETTGGVGVATVNLVLTPAGVWQAFTICTELETIKGTQTTFGPGRDARSLRGNEWMAERIKEQAFEDRDPEVLIVGAGQAGLFVAARLKSMGVKSLIVDKHARVGDQWRERYDSLRLQDLICKHDHGCSHGYILTFSRVHPFAFPSVR